MFLLNTVYDMEIKLVLGFVCRFMSSGKRGSYRHVFCRICKEGLWSNTLFSNWAPQSLGVTRNVDENLGIFYVLVIIFADFL